jgi:effector-binding domain-containing protein
VVSVRTYPTVRAAVHEHRGPYEGLPAVYEPLRQWIVDQGLEPGEQTREIYPANPGNTANEQDYVTRVCWPVTLLVDVAGRGGIRILPWPATCTRWCA